MYGLDLHAGLITFAQVETLQVYCGAGTWDVFRVEGVSEMCPLMGCVWARKSAIHKPRYRAAEGDWAAKLWI